MPENNITLEIAFSIFKTITKHTIENQIKSKDIERIHSVSGSTVRDVEAAARRAGFKIGSSSHGSFLARNNAELEGTIHHLEARAKSIYKTTTAMKKDDSSTLFDMTA